jgi:hypothetical protein
VQLQPKRPPGRADRKAAAYAAEILRLRAEGYTYESIRQALADVGIQLSESALRREVRRQHKRVACVVPGERPPPPMHVAPTLPLPQTIAKVPPPGLTGREHAEAFFNAHPSNSLLRSQEAP